MIEKPQYGLAWFRISFERLPVKAHTKGEHVLRFEATVHNTKELRCRRGLNNLSEIITRLARMTVLFATALDCADISFVPSGILDDLPAPPAAGVARTVGTDLNRLRIRAALTAPVALASGPARLHRCRVRGQGPAHDQQRWSQQAPGLRLPPWCGVQQRWKKALDIRAGAVDWRPV